MLLAFAGILLGSRPLAPPFKLPDASMYRAMAQGHTFAVPQPFVWRPLAPLLVHGLHVALGCSVEHGFQILAGICIGIALITVLHFAAVSEAPCWLLLFLVVVPFWAELWNVAAMPDPLYAALLSLLLLSLGQPRYRWVAALLMFPMMLARESTNLLLLCLLLVGWRFLRWTGSLLAIAAAVAGSLVVRHWAAGAAPNPEHLQGSLYLLGKMVCNLLRTFGVEPWSNVYTELCTVPAWQVPLHLGPVRAIGPCWVSDIMPLQALRALLCTFGLLPLFALALWRQRDRTAPASVQRNLCVLYGVTSYVLSLALGTWYSRLVGYAWPLFLIGVPLLFRKAKRAEEQPWNGVVLVILVCLQCFLAVLAFGHWFATFQPFEIVATAVGAVLLFMPAGKGLLRSWNVRPTPVRGRL